MHKTKPARRTLCLLLALLVLAVCIFGVPPSYRSILKMRYPQKYSALVEQWAAEYDIDPLLLYAVIRTESGFDPHACSNVEAHGLMQITEVTFDWIKSQIAPNEDISFADLYDPALNIRFGAYYMKRCLSRYHEDVPTAAAAYHSGWGTVDALLSSTAYSSDGNVLNVFPYQQMNNYVAKISHAYARYRLLYSPEGA